MTVLGRELQRRGHRIVLFDSMDAQKRVQEAGIEFRSVARVESAPGEWERATARMGELAGMQASRFVGHWLGHLFTFDLFHHYHPQRHILLVTRGCSALARLALLKGG